MNETIFSDRRKDLKRRSGVMPYGVRECRRTSRDRRSERSNAAVVNWWLKVNYANQLS